MQHLSPSPTLPWQPQVQLHIECELIRFLCEEYFDQYDPDQPEEVENISLRVKLRLEEDIMTAYSKDYEAEDLNFQHLMQKIHCVAADLSNRFGDYMISDISIKNPKLGTLILHC